MPCDNLFEFVADIGQDAQAECHYDALLRANTWQQNTAILVFQLFCQGVSVDDLALVTSGTINGLRLEDNDVGFSFNYPGAEVLINTPELGFVQVTLSSAVTDLMEGEYRIAAQFVWPTKTLEWRFKKTLNVMRDQILFP